MAVEFSPDVIKRTVVAVANMLYVLDQYRLRLLNLDFSDEAGKISKIFDIVDDLMRRDSVWFDDVYVTIREVIKLLRDVDGSVKLFVDGLAGECSRLSGEARDVCLRELTGYRNFYGELHAMLSGLIIALDNVATAVLNMERFALRPRSRRK